MMKTFQKLDLTTEEELQAAEEEENRKRVAESLLAAPDDGNITQIICSVLCSYTIDYSSMTYYFIIEVDDYVSTMVKQSIKHKVILLLTLQITL